MGDRRILIVDDDPDWHEIIAAALQDVLHDIGREADYVVMYAKDYQQALDLLKQHTYTLVSMDINLSKAQEASEGLELLDELETSASDTCSIIVSGESEHVSASRWQQYILDGFQKCNILRFIGKASWDGQEFKTTVKSILLYADALSYLKAGDWEQAIGNWKRARQVAPELGKKFQDVGVLVERARLETSNPITGLPTGKVVEAKLKELLGIARPWSVLYIRVENLEEYYETYGHVQGDNALKTIGSFLRNQVGRADFIGHPEHGLFMVVVEDPEGLKVRLLDSFNVEREMDVHLYPRQDRDNETERRVKTGMPELKLAIRVVSDRDGPFADIFDISRAGSGSGSAG